MRCRFTGSWFKPNRRHSFAGDDVPQIFVFLGAIAIFGRKKKIFPNFLPDTLGGGVSQPDPPPPPPLQTPPTPPSPPSNTWLVLELDRGLGLVGPVRTTIVLISFSAECRCRAAAA